MDFCILQAQKWLFGTSIPECWCCSCISGLETGLDLGGRDVREKLLSCFALWFALHRNQVERLKFRAFSFIPPHSLVVHKIQP